MDTAEQLRRHAATLLEEASRLDSLPEDDYPNLAVIMWTRQFATEFGQLRPIGRRNSGPARTYHYVALKVGEKWYVTGRSSQMPEKTWDQLWNDHLSHATHLWYVTAMQEVEL